MTFVLHKQLAADCRVVGDLPLCQVLLMDDAQYPWFILVPRRAGITEVHQLSADDRAQLWQESDRFCHQLEQLFAPDKLNIAALGNMVPQLHVHHIARFKTDPAWPAPVWGKHLPQPYTEDEAVRRIERLRKALFLS